VKAERVLGWVTHYATGVAFAGLLFAVLGPEWTRAPAPLKNCLRSVANHGVFGVGLYAAAAVIARVAQ